MTRIFLVAFCFGVFFGYTWKAFAAESTGISTTQIQAPQSSPPSSTSIYIGLSGNSGAVNMSDASNTDLKSSGSFSEAMVLGTYETRKLVFDLGFGTFSSSISGKSNAAPGVNSFTLNAYDMNKAGELAHVGARYRLTDAVEAGAFAQLLFGTDVGFASSYLRTDHTTAWLTGADALYGFNWFGLRWKTGVRAFRSIGLDERTLTAYQGVLQTAFAI